MSSERRLHPASVVFGLGAQLREFAVPLLAALVLGSRRGNFDTWALPIIVLYAATAFWRYYWFRYRFEANDLVVKSGLIFRNERHIPYTRVQNIDAVRNVVHRALGVVSVRIDTGSGGEADARLSVVGWPAYEEMRQRVLGERDLATEAGEAVQPGGAETPSARRLLLKLPIREVMLQGLLENRGAIVIAGLFGLLWESGIADAYLDRLVGDDVPGRGFVRDFIGRAGTTSITWSRIGLAALMLVAFLAVLRLFSVVLAVLRIGGFMLSRIGDDLRAEYGLLTRVTATIPIRRIQTLTVSDGVLHRLARRASIRVDTAGGAGRSANEARRESLAPIVRREAQAALVAEVLPELDVAQVTWTPAAPGALTRATRVRIVVAALLGLAAIYPAGWTAGAGTFIAFLLWGLIAARQNIRHLGWATTSGHVLFQSGWLRRHVTVARFARMQSVSLVESPFDRRWGMAQVHVDTAGASAGSHRIQIPYLTRADASALHARLAAAAAETAFRW
jgi:putative membrane protein